MWYIALEVNHSLLVHDISTHLNIYGKKTILCNVVVVAATVAVAAAAAVVFSR